MQLTVNGETRECPIEVSISRLLKNLDINEAHVAVELNNEIVPRAKLGEKILKENDNLEIVTFVGGG